jgi:hypothetical protein
VEALTEQDAGLALTIAGTFTDAVFADGHEI